MKATVPQEASQHLAIGVIADTHGVLSRAIPPLFSGVTHIIHAGDVGRRSVLRRLEEIAPVTAISGNADSGKLAASLPSVARGEIGGVRFLVLHKPKAVRRHLQAAREEGVRLVVTGHLHEPGCRWEDGILYLNPGTATAPEEGDSQATVAIVTLLPDGLAVSFIPVPRPPATRRKSKAKAHTTKSSDSGSQADGEAPGPEGAVVDALGPDGRTEDASAVPLRAASGLPPGGQGARLAVLALGPIVVLDSLRADQLGGARAYFNARYLLAAAAAAPLPATATLGNLASSFVERAAAEMRWPTAAADTARYAEGSIDESGVPLLRSLREALQNGRMLRKYRCAFHATTRARALLAPGREGELYMALFEAYLARPDACSVAGCPAASRLRRGVPQLLWLLLQSGGAAVTVSKLAAGIAADPVVSPDGCDDRDLEELGGTLRQGILDPLAELGLIEMTFTANGYPQRDGPHCEVRVTPLFERFVIAAACLN